MAFRYVRPDERHERQKGFHDFGFTGHSRQFQRFLRRRKGKRVFRNFATKCTVRSMDKECEFQNERGQKENPTERNSHDWKVSGKQLRKQRPVEHDIRQEEQVYFRCGLRVHPHERLCEVRVSLRKQKKKSEEEIADCRIRADLLIGFHVRMLPYCYRLSKCSLLRKRKYVFYEVFVFKVRRK